MARVAFFTERLPPDTDPISTFSYDLAVSLADQQHDIRIFSTYLGSQGPRPHPRIEIVRPFRNWGWFEIPRMIPLLFDFRPDIIHVIQPRNESLAGLTNAMNALPALAPMVGRAAVVSTFYDLTSENLKEQRKLLLLSDAVTLINRPQFDLANSFFETTSRRPLTAILPISGTNPGSHSETHSAFGEEDFDGGPTDALREFFLETKSVVFIPGSISDHRELQSVVKVLSEVLAKFPESGLVFGGGWGRVKPLERRRLMEHFASSGVDARVFITGSLSPASEKFAMERARVVFASRLAPESLGLTRTLKLALESSAVLIIGTDQAEIDAISWEDHEQAIVIEQEPESWKTALAEALSNEDVVRRIRERVSDFARQEIVDQPANVMSRIYSQIT